MFSSLKASNGSFASVGNLQVQPAPDVVAPVQGSTAGASSQGVLPAYQAPLTVSTMTLANGELGVVNNTTLSTMTTSLINDKSFIIPVVGQVNKILPSFAFGLNPVVFNLNTEQFAPTTRKFEPYEQLTGISQERPELVMLTSFLPLFIEDVSNSQPSMLQAIENGGIYPHMTDAGRMIDVQLHARNVKHDDYIKTARVLKTIYDIVKSSYTKRRTDFEKNVDSLREAADFLLQLVRSTELLKSQLDVRNDIHIVTTEEMAAHLARLHKKPVKQPKVLKSPPNIPPKYSVPDVLTDLGYTSINVRQKFSSTKIWMQMLYELREIVQQHSLEFIDVDSTAQRRDDRPVTVLLSNTKRFGVKDSIPDTVDVAEISTLSIKQIQTTINTLNQVWHSLYQDVHFKSPEARMAALINFVSKEFRYSAGLSDVDVQRALSDQYGYTVSSNENSDVFDAIFGRFGNNITEFPAEQSNSLAGVAQRQPAINVAVLPFESKYIEGDSGTLTPGSAYYVDHTLNTDGNSFDTSRIDELTALLEKSYKSFGTIVSDMNILTTDATSDQGGSTTKKTLTSFSTKLSNPAEIVRFIASSLIDQKTGAALQKAADDNMGAVYAYCAVNERVKSALFMYTMAKITRQYHKTKLTTPFGTTTTTTPDNTPLTEMLISHVLTELEKATVQTQPGNQATKNSAKITRDAIAVALKTGTHISTLVESTMKAILTTFTTGSKAMIDNRTRLNGHPDTIMMMTVFDLIVTMIARYNGQLLVSSNYNPSSYKKGTLTFNIMKSTTNRKASFNDLLTRLGREAALTYKLVYTVTNTLSKLSTVMKNYSNYLKTPAAITRLQHISNIIGDPALFNMLMSAQQIMLLTSTVHDLSDHLETSATPANNGDVDGDGDLDADDELKVLDDSIITPALRTALYGLFGTDEFASKKGYNKKILTVGIPLGFTRLLNQRVSVNNLKSTSFVDKQNDIVNVVVYKVDLQNSDIIYKPKKFMFELSRFPIRNDKRYLNIPNRPSIDDVLRAIPTRDFGQSQSSPAEITYWSLSSNDASKGRKAAFADSSYSFLTQDEKASIIRNHIMSYLSEVYVKLLTGVNLGEHNFDLVEQPRLIDNEFTKMITVHSIADIVRVMNSKKAQPGNSRSTGGVLFSSTVARNLGPVAGKNVGQRQAPANATGTASDVSQSTQFKTLQSNNDVKTLEQRGVGTLESLLAQVSRKNVPLTVSKLRAINNLARVLSTYSDPLLVSKKVLSPKQFDRVFNVIIDPDDFEIDYDKTMKTPHGKLAFEQMLTRGDIVPATENEVKISKALAKAMTNMTLSPTGRSTQNRTVYKYRDRDRSSGDLAFEKYFVTVETYGEEGV